MRKAILEGLVPEFATTPFSNQMVQQAFGRSGSAGTNSAGLMMTMGQRGSGNNSGGGATGMMARGGQLVVAGSVVGQWGGNYGVATPHQHGGMAVGPRWRRSHDGRQGPERRTGRLPQERQELGAAKVVKALL